MAKQQLINTEKLTAGTDKDAMEQAAKKTVKAIEKKANALKKLTIQYVPVDQIRPNSYNPNRQDPHAFELLVRSITEDGFTQPIVVLKVTEETKDDQAFKGAKVGDTVVVDGEHRWRAAQHLGFKEVPVVYTDMTPSQMRIATLRHNRARGDEDIELTSLVLKDLRELGSLDWAQDSLMLDDVEMDKLLNDISAPDALAGDQFNESWAPDKGASGTVGTVDAGHMVDGTPQALLKAREQEAALSAAKNEEERKAVLKDHNVYRMALMFTGEEAEIVKKALGDKPAQRVLEWSKSFAAAHPDPK